MVEFKDFITSPEIAHSSELLHSYLSTELGSTFVDQTTYRIERKSIDARSRQIKVNLRIGFYPKDFDFTFQQKSKLPKLTAHAPQVVVIGSGPAGLFGALELIQLGIKPIILERGKDVRDRRRDLAAINRFNIVDSNSNYCFGEGGAGTYSDGKLYTRSTKRGDIKKVLETFVEHGANQNILFEAHPHIGTNKLPGIIASIRNSIIEAGGEVHFNERVIDFQIEHKQIKQVHCESGLTIDCENVLLATGHSARDIFELLHKKQIKIEYKPFAIGVRIEHRQSLIDTCQYKLNKRPEYLPPASFSLVTQTKFKGLQRGVFSFCMCPGGFIVPSATAQNQVVVNGMSPSRRDSVYANSGIVVSILPEDLSEYKDYGPLAGMYLQESLERKSNEYSQETQKAISQLTGDFIQKKSSKSAHETSYIPGLIPGEMREVLPEFISEPLALGLQDFNRKISNFSTNIGQIIGLESRTSSPVKIPRDSESLEHIEIKGLFPCGEGAGFAGGIMSAALDGIKVAQGIYQKIHRS